MDGNINEALLNELIELRQIKQEHEALLQINHRYTAQLIRYKLQVMALKQRVPDGGLPEC